MFEWSATYQREGRYQIQNTLEDYPGKVVVVKDLKQLKQRLEQWRSPIERTSG